jgi:hypothetical protein
MFGNHFGFWVLVCLLLIAFMAHVLREEHKAALARTERYIKYLQKQQPPVSYEPVNWQELYDRYYFQELAKIVEEARNDFVSDLSH